MKKQLLFIALFVASFINAQSIEFTSAELTTAEVGSTVTVNYKFTSAVDVQIYCAINKYTESGEWNAKIADAFLSPVSAGTDVTGSFDLFIPAGTTLTADLPSTFHYKLVIEMRTVGGTTWLAGAYPSTKINIIAATNPSSNSITITSDLTAAEVGSTINVNYKYTSSGSDNYIYCAINRYGDETFNSWQATLVGGDVASAPAGTDVTGSFSFTIPANATLTANLTSPVNYKLAIEMKEKVGWTVLTEQKVAKEISIVAAGTLSIDSITEQLNNISIYPNPTNNRLQINGINNLDVSTIKIVNILGKEVYISREKKSQIDVSGLSSGIYIISILSGDSQKRMKFIKN